MRQKPRKTRRTRLSHIGTEALEQRRLLSVSLAVVQASTPFGGHPLNISDTIEAENFDNGGEGVAFHDTTPQNLGGQYRSTAVDINAGGSNGFDVGYTATGEWLKYSITNPAAGTFVLQSAVASSMPGGTFHVEVDGQNVTGAMSVPNTGGWFNFQPVDSPKFNLSAGNHTLQVVMDSTGTLGAVGNFDYFRFVEPPVPFHGTPFNINTDKIEAEDFDNGGEGVAYHDSTPQNITGAYRNTAVDIAAVGNASNGYAVGYTYPGEWLTYTINAPAQGNYALQATVANYQQGGTFHVEIDGQNVTGALTVPNTGPWDTWQTITSQEFTISAGNHQMRVVMDSPGYWGNIGDFDSFHFKELPVPFYGTPFNITQTIQAEDFDSGSEGVAYHDTTPQNIQGKYRNTGVDVFSNSGTSNGYGVGYTAPGEWLSYTVHNPTLRGYALEARVANHLQGGTFHVEIDGQNVTGAMTVPDTGPWDTWQTITSQAFTVSAGTHQMKVVMDSPGYWGNIGDFDWFQFVPAERILLHDDFNSGQLDPSKWTVNLTSKGGTVKPQVNLVNGQVQFISRGYLNTTDQFDPKTLGKISISGRVSIGKNDFFEVLTRTTGVPAGVFGEASGLEFTVIQEYQSTSMRIEEQFVSDALTTTNTVAIGALNVQPGDVFDFLIEDDGSHVSMTFTNANNPADTGHIEANTAHGTGSNFISFHNRESDGDPAQVTTLDDVTISEI